MGISKIKCPKCGNVMTKKSLKKTKGKCSKCGYRLMGLFARFSSARSRIRSKYS